MAMVLGAGLMFLLGWVLHGPSGRDDAYKTYWPASTLGTYGEITNYNQESLEQSSSLLHVVVLGGVKAITDADMPGIALWTSLFLGGLACAFCWGLAREAVPGLAWMPPVLLALFPPAVYWGWSGMESTLALAVWTGLAWAVVRWVKGGHEGWVVLGIVLAEMVRPEMGLALVAACVAACLLKGLSLRRAAALAGLVLVWGVALALWRESRTGEPFPQPVMAKADMPDLGQVRAGLKYLFFACAWQPLTWAMAAGVLWGMSRRVAGVAGPPLAAMALALVGAVVMAGGDWMENGRFLVPVAGIGVVLSVQAASTFRFKPGWLLVVMPILALCGSVGVVRTSTGSPVWDRHVEPLEGHWTERMNRVHARDLAVVPRLLEVVDSLFETRPARPVVMSQQAGMVAYHLASRRESKFYRFIDLVALSTEDFTQCPLTRNRGGGWGGLNMDIQFFVEHFRDLSRECAIPWPDIIYDLDNEERFKQTILEQAGYKVVWRAEGEVGGGPWQMPVSRIQFIAVSGDLPERPHGSH